jgi:hypothetical protein
MYNFPEVMIVRYYEGWIIDVSYSDDWSDRNKDLIEEKLQKEQEENKHLETYKIFYRWEGVKSEE